MHGTYFAQLMSMPVVNELLMSPYIIQVLFKENTTILLIGLQCMLLMVLLVLFKNMSMDQLIYLIKFICF